MTSPTFATLNGHSSLRQEGFLTQLGALDRTEKYEAKTKTPSDNTSDKIAVQLQKLKERGRMLEGAVLKVLRTISQSSEPLTAVQIGKRVNLSRTPALNYANKLSDLAICRLEAVSSAKTGIRPTYFFSLAPDLSQEAVSLFLAERDEGRDCTNSWERSAKNPSVNNMNGFSKDQLSKLSLGHRRILRTAAESGLISANSLEKVLNIPKSSIYAQLKRLLNLGLLTEQLLDDSRKANSRVKFYSLSQNLTPEQVAFIGEEVAETQGEKDEAFTQIQSTNLVDRQEQSNAFNNMKDTRQELMQQPPSKDNEVDVLEVLTAMAERILSLEKEVEQLKQGSTKAKANSTIQAILKPRNCDLGR